MDYLEQRRKLRQMVQERLDYGRDYTDEEVEDTIDEVLMEQENLELCSVELRRRLRKELFDSLEDWIFCRFLWMTALLRRL